MKVKIIASVALLSVFSTSYAKQLASSGEWRLEDTSTRKQPNGFCIAYTEADFNGATYTLQISHPAKRAAPTEIQISRKDGKGASSFTADLISGETISFANSGKVNKMDILWHIPQNSSKILAHFESKKELRLKPADGSRDQRITFSDDGFKKIREKFEEKCLNNSPLIDIPFESSFLLKQGPLDPSKLTVEGVGEIRRLFLAGYDVHLNINGAQDELGKLRSKFQKELNEASSLMTLIERLERRDIPSLVRDARENDDLQIRKTAELANLNSLLLAQRAAIVASERVLNTAETAIAPFRSEHASRAQTANRARGNVDDLAARINSLSSSISNSSSRIGQLSAEARSLEGNLARLQGEVRPTRLDLARAERDLRSFDGKQELVRRLSLDRGYADARREIPTLEKTLSIVGRALDESRALILTREAELRACQARTSSFTAVETMIRMPAQVRERPQRDENRPNRPGRDGSENRPAPDRTPTTPTTPTTPEPTPTPVPTPTPSTPTPQPPVSTVDCSRQVENVRLAKVVERDLTVQFQEAKRDHQAALSRMSQAENRVESEIQRIYAQLESEARQSQIRLNNLESQMASTDQRIEVIMRREIPSLESQLQSSQQQRAMAESEISQLEPVAARLENELDAYEARVGWNAKLSAVVNAQRTLSLKNQEFNSTDAQRQSTEAVIANCNQMRPRLSQELSAKQAQKTQSEARLVAVNKALEPFEAEKLKIDEKATNLRNQLAGLATEFEGKLIE